MTAREFAAAINRPYPTVALWLRSELIPEATFIQLGGMRVWQIPMSVLDTFKPPKIGRPKKEPTADKSKKGGGRRGAHASADIAGTTDQITSDEAPTKLRHRASKSPIAKKGMKKTAKKKGVK